MAKTGTKLVNKGQKQMYLHVKLISRTVYTTCFMLKLLHENTFTFYFDVYLAALILYPRLKCSFIYLFIYLFVVLHIYSPLLANDGVVLDVSTCM